MKLTKTVVGSFPPKHIPVEESIKQIIELQLKYGIDIVSDGEQRSDMIGYFGALKGLDMTPRGPCVASRISAMDNPKDFVKLKDLILVRNHLKKIGREDVDVKVAITGPVTLGFSAALNGLTYYSSISDPSLYTDFAEALNPLILEVAKAGCHVQIDEPSLSSRVMDSSKAVKIINESCRDFPDSFYDEGKLVLHTCGALNENLLRDFMKLDAPILSLAFSSPIVKRNIEIISRVILRDNGKKLGVGCVSVQASRSEDVEDTETIIRRLKAIREKVGDDLIAFIHPDCGLRGTSQETAELILKRMNLATEHISP
ncbi:MAG: hypothetical protein ACUVQ8_02660 [Nitrososphaeria archaeon]